MGMFRKAEQSKQGLKVLAWGDTGSGKSTFGLSFPKIWAIDSEAGLAFYEGNPNLDQILNTTSVSELEEALEEIEENSSELQTLLIDSETKFADNLQLSFLNVAEKRAKRKGESVEDANLSPREHGKIKMITKRLQSIKIMLASKGVNIVSIAQMKDIKEKKGDSFVKVGEAPNAGKDIEYDYDIIVKLFTEKTKDGEVYKAEIQKDRTGTFKKGDIIENPSFKMWEHVYNKASKLKENVVNFKEDLGKDEKTVQKELDDADTLGKKFGETFKGLTPDNQAKVKALLKEKGITNPLKPDDKLEEMQEILNYIAKL